MSEVAQATPEPRASGPSNRAQAAGAGPSGNRRPIAAALGRARVDPLEAEAETVGEAVAMLAPAPSSSAARGRDVPPDVLRRVGHVLPGDFGHVQVHTDPGAHAKTAALAARAFTTGADVYLGRGERADDAALMAHELTHVAQQARGGAPRIQRAAIPGQLLLTDVLTPDGTAFRPEFQALQKAYNEYLADRTAESPPAPPALWVVRYARGAHRALLVKTLGADLGVPRAAPQGPIIDIFNVQPPPGYTPEAIERNRQLAMQRPERLYDRVTIPAEQLATGQISVGYRHILVGNLAEIYADTIREARLKELRKKWPTAEIARGVRADFGKGSKLFTDDPIVAISNGRLWVLWVPEVKGGSHGGSEATEQIHTWIEKHLDDGFKLILEGNRVFVYAPGSEGPGFAVGLARAPRAIITPRGASQLGLGSDMALTTAEIERLELDQWPAEIRYDAILHMRAMVEAHILKSLKDPDHSPAEVASLAELMKQETIKRVLGEHGGLALVGGRVYRLRSTSLGVTLEQLPLTGLMLAAPAGAPAAAPSPSVPPSAPPASGLQAPKRPAQPPRQPPLPTLPSGPGNGGPRLPILRPFGMGGGPAHPYFPFPVEIGQFVIVDGIVRDRVTGERLPFFAEGQTWVAVRSPRPGGVSIDGQTGQLVASALVETPVGLRTLETVPYARPTPRTMGTGMKAAAGVAGAAMLVNELLAPHAAMRDDQRRGIQRTEATMRFLSQFGAQFTWDIWDTDAQRAVSAEQATPEVGSRWGYKYPRIRKVAPGQFEQRVREEVRDLQTLTVWLDGATTLGAIRQRGDRFYLWDEFNDVTDLVHGLRSELMIKEDARLRASMQVASGPVFRLKPGAATRLFPDLRGSLIETTPFFLGKDPWVVTLSRRSTYLGLGTDQILAVPANAAASEGALSAWYAVRDSPETVLKDARKQGREILSETRSPWGVLEGFVAGPDAEGRVGVTRYLPHPVGPGLTIAIGEVKRFWVSAADLQPVDPTESAAYAHGIPSAPPAPRFYTTSNRDRL